MTARIDRSGPLRPGKIAASVPLQPSAVLPALAVIMAYIARRPDWADKMPFPVPAELYEAAREEMQVHMRKRGFALPRDENLDEDNFLLLGTPVTREREAVNG